MGSATYKTGSGTWTVPAGVTSFNVYVVGKGGDGAAASGSNAGGGGGGGGYAYKTGRTASPGDSYTYDTASNSRYEFYKTGDVSSLDLIGTNGGNASGTTGGTAGVGSATGGTGTSSGIAGTNGSTGGVPSYGGGGGGSGYGASGGPGAWYEDIDNNSTSGPGTEPGGGGGGGCVTNSSPFGASGGALGMIYITWTDPPPSAKSRGYIID